MFVYWGGLDGGKGHIRSFARLNSKTQVLWLPLHIKKLYTQNHINEDTWRDETYHQIIYHNIDDELRKCERKQDRVWRPHKFYHSQSSIRPKESSTEKVKRKKKRKEYTQEHISKYTQKEYIGTSVYYDILMTNNNEGMCKPITHDVIKDYYDEIFKDVDIMSYILPSWAMKDLAGLLRKSVNVIPYKSDLIDSFVSKMDGFVNFRESEYGNDLIEVYNEDRNRVWRWLDSFHEEDEKIKRRLNYYDIPYVMFDLDQDSYTDFFGWELDLDRKYSHRGARWEGERYEKVVEIAKEYIHLRSL